MDQDLHPALAQLEAFFTSELGRFVVLCWIVFLAWIISGRIMDTVFGRKK